MGLSPLASPGHEHDLTPYHTVICSKWNQLGNDYMIEVKPDGIYYQQMTSSSGTGRIKVKSRPRDLIIPSSEYDSIEYVGEEMVISEHLRNDLKENGIC